MATKDYCYFAGNFEKELKRYMPQYTPQELAYWIGGYDANQKSEQDYIDREDTSDANLIAVRDKLIKAEKDIHTAAILSRQIRATQDNLVAPYSKCSKDFTPKEFADACNYVADMFSILAQHFYNQQKSVLNCSKQDFINGITIGKQAFGGEAYIFDKCFKSFIKLTKLNLPEQQKELLYKVIDNFSALCVFSRRILRQTEGLSLMMGNFAEQDNIEYYQNSEEFSFDPETTKPEHWMEQSDCRNPFASFTTNVKNTLRTLPLIKFEFDKASQTYKPKRQIDSFGRPACVNENVVYKELRKLFIGCTTSDAMVEALENSKLPYAEALLQKIEADPGLKTALFVALRKNNQLYALFSSSFENGQYKFKTFIANKLVNPLLDIYRNRALNKLMPKSTQGEQPYLFVNDMMDENVREKLLSLTSYLPQSAQDRINQQKETKQKETKQEETSEETSEESQNIFENISSENQKRLSAWRELPVFPKLGTTEQSKYEVISTVFKALGITDILTEMKVDYSDVICRILGTESSIAQFMNDFSGILSYLAKDNGEAARKMPLSSTFVQNEKTQNMKTFGVHMSKMLTTIANIAGISTRQLMVRYFNSKGDSISMFSHTVPSSMADKIEKLQSFIEADDVEGFEEYLNSEFKSNPLFYDSEKQVWMNDWLEKLEKSVVTKTTLTVTGRKVTRKTFRENSFAKKVNFRRMLGQTKANNGRPFEDFPAQTHALQMITSFFSEQKQAKGYSVFPVFTLADSMINRELTAPVYSIDKIKKLMYKVYQSERKRQEQIKLFNKWCDEQGLPKIDNYKNKENEFSYLTFLNNVQDLPNTEEEFIALLDTFMKSTIGTINDSVNATFDGKPTTFAYLKSIGVLETDSKGNYIYVKDLNRNGQLQTNIEKWFWNTFYNNIQQFQLFTIDTAFYKNTKDFQKRYKELSAAGTVLDLTAEWNGQKVFTDRSGNFNASQKCIYFKDISVNAENSNPEFMEVVIRQYTTDEQGIQNFFATYGHSEDEYIAQGGKKEERNKALQKLLGIDGFARYTAYMNNTLTDGQGYRSLTSYRKIAIASGEWTDEHEAIYNKIIDLTNKAKSRNLTAEEYASLRQEAQLILQPLKPYYFGFEHRQFTSNGRQYNISIPVQHKYAEAVLIPILLPEGSKIREMAEFMEANDIDMMCSTKCVKVGNWGAVDLNSNPDESITNILKTHISNPEGIHVLSMEHYRIQTNVPEHIDANQLFGTQIRKLIMASIKTGYPEIGDYTSYVEGGEVTMPDGTKVKLTGEHLVQFYNVLIVCNILQDFKKFETSIDTLEKVANILQRGVINNDREVLDRLSAYAVTEDLESTIIPLIDPFVAHNAVAQLLSGYKKQVNKQKIKGGSAVQVSAFGITQMKAETQGKQKSDIENSGGLKIVTNEENTNILYMECEIPFVLNIAGQDLNFDDYCNPDGTLIMSKDGKTTKIEKEFPGILDIVAYRIPTEKHYSMLNLKVVRFSRPELGGTMKVPAQCTTIAGFDFDIDKLYFFKKEFKVKDIQYHHTKLTSNELFNIWSNFYNEHPDIMLRLEQYAVDTEDYTVDKNGNRQFNHPINYYWDKAGIEMDKQEAIQPYIESFCQKNNIDLNEVKVERTFYEYDTNKSPLEQPKAVRNNMLLQIIQKRLQDPETLMSRITPGGFENPKQAARILGRITSPDTKVDLSKFDSQALNELKEQASKDEEIKEPEYNPCDPITNILYTQQNQVAGNLIGIFANQSTNHAFCTIVRECKLKNPPQFLGNKFDDFIHAPKDKDGNQRDVDLYVAEYLAASVDAIKDPVLKFLDFNLLNADTGAVMARLGYNSYEIGLLFSQPILKEVWNYAANKGCSLATAMHTVSREWLKSVKTSKTEALKEINSKQLSPQNELQMVKDILQNKDNSNNFKSNKENVLRQIAALNTFEEFLKISQDMTELVRITKFTAANSVKSTMSGMYSQSMAAKKAIDKYRKEAEKEDSVKGSLSFTLKLTSYLGDELKNRMPLDDNEQLLQMSDEDYLKAVMSNPFAFEQCMFDQNRKVIKVLEKYFPYDAPIFKDTREGFADLYKFGVPSEKDIESLHSFIVTDALEHDGSTGSFCPTAMCSIRIKGTNTDLTNNQFYTDSYIIERLYDALITNGFMDKSQGVEQLKLSYKQVYNEKTNKDITVRSIDASPVMNSPMESKEMFVFQWANFANNNDEITSDFEININGTWRNLKKYELAEMLFFYFFYKSGMNFNPTGALSLVPTTLKADLSVNPKFGTTYSDFLKTLGDKKKKVSKAETNSRLRRYLLKNLDNTHLVHNVVYDTSEDSLYSLLMEDIKNHGNDGVLIMDLRKGTPYTDYLDLLCNVKDKEMFITPILKIGNDYYVIANTDPNIQLNQIGQSGIVTYIKVTQEELLSGDINQSSIGKEIETPSISTEETENEDNEQDNISQIESNEEIPNSPLQAVSPVKDEESERMWDLFQNLILNEFLPQIKEAEQMRGEPFVDYKDAAHEIFMRYYEEIASVLRKVPIEELEKIKENIDTAFTPGSPIQASFVYDENGNIKDIQTQLCV